MSLRDRLFSWRGPTGLLWIVLTTLAALWKFADHWSNAEFILSKLSEAAGLHDLVQGVIFAPWFLVIVWILGALLIWSAIKHPVTAGGATPQVGQTPVAPVSEVVIRVESDRFSWRRGRANNGSFRAFPHCPQHDVRLLFKYRKSSRDERWSTEELSDYDQPSSYNRNVTDGCLHCPAAGGHDFPWFSQSATFGDARVKAEMLIKREIELKASHS